MTDRHIRLASIRAVESIAEANDLEPVRAHAFASVTLPDATYYAQEKPNVADLVAAVERAEAEALAQHEAGTCHLSEWSCSYCEEAQR